MATLNLKAIDMAAAVIAQSGRRWDPTRISARAARRRGGRVPVARLLRPGRGRAPTEGEGTADPARWAATGTQWLGRCGSPAKPHLPGPSLRRRRVPIT